jgi:Na+/melibiose symporter-like transporter
VSTDDRVLVAGAAACVACCAGPIWGALAAIGVGTALGYVLAGTVALVAGVAALAWVVRRRRHRHRPGARTPVSISVERRS